MPFTLSGSLTLQFPEWCRVTITRELNGKERRFVGPKVYWCEAYAKWADTDVPNEMWSNRPVGHLEKCAEAGALRRAFPEEIGSGRAKADYSSASHRGDHTRDIGPNLESLGAVAAMLVSGCFRWTKKEIVDRAMG